MVMVLSDVFSCSSSLALSASEKFFSLMKIITINIHVTKMARQVKSTGKYTQVGSKTVQGFIEQTTFQRFSLL
jgi:hypothetical protein